MKLSSNTRENVWRLIGSRKKIQNRNQRQSYSVVRFQDLGATSKALTQENWYKSMEYWIVKIYYFTKLLSITRYSRR